VVGDLISVTKEHVGFNATADARTVCSMQGCVRVQNVQDQGLGQGRNFQGQSQGDDFCPQDRQGGATSNHLSSHS